MNIKYLIIYLSTVFIASIIPGPSMLLALNHGIKYGAKKTVFTALGNVTATFIQAIMTIAGLSFILIKTGIIFSIIKYIGAVYIIYIGIKTIVQAKNNLVLNFETAIKVGKKKDLFNEAFIVTIGNPKAIIFFTALFPQFINSNNNNNFTVSIIMGLLLIIAFVCMMIYGIFGQNIKSILNSSKRKKNFNYLIGSSFIGLGIGLAFGKVEK